MNITKNECRLNTLPHTRGPKCSILCTWVQCATFFMDRPGHHFCLLIGQKKNWVEDVEILLPVKFLWIPYSGFREVKNVSANQRLGRPSWFSDRPEKHKLGRGSWYLASYQVSSNSLQRFQRRSRKCFSQSQGQGDQLVFPINPKNTNLIEDVEILLPVKFRWILISSFRGQVENAKVYAGRTDGQTTRYDNSPLEPSAQVSLKYNCIA